MSGRISISLLAVLAAVAVCVPQPVTSTTSAASSLVYTVAPDYQPLAWLRGQERFPRGAALFISNPNGARALASKFAATADADVSFDASSILFAGKRTPGDHWQIWEAALLGGAARQLTRCELDCVRPLYLPGNRFVYAHNLDGGFALEIASLDAAYEIALQLTQVPGNFLPLDVLRDGRILFEAAQPIGDGDLPELYTVYTDGSGMEAYRCDHGYGRFAGKQLSSGDVVFSRNGSLYRFTSAIAHEVEIPSPAGSYGGDVAEMADGDWLVSWHAAGRNFFELREWKPGSETLRPAAARAQANVIQPVVVKPRPVPNRHPSGLHEWAYANVLCLNAYTSKHRIAEGTIASVRLYTRDRVGAARLLGSAQVEKGGSFYLRVPGDQPLKIELLDRAGTTLQKEHGWFWLRKGEQRVCVGCHAGPETAPENAVPAVLLRSTVATDLTGAPSSQAGGH